MRITIDAEYLSSRVQCTREDKQDCLPVVRQLVALAYIARERGLLSMEEAVRDRARYPDAFLRKAVELTVEIADTEKIGRVLYNLIITSKYMGNFHFLKNVIIAETMLSVSKSEDLDYVFTHLVPSFFGMEFAPMVEETYRAQKKAMMTTRKLIPM